MPADLCTLDNHETECVPHKGYKKQMLGKYAMILNNQRRFVSDKYDGDSPIVKESVITWIDFPLEPTIRIYNVQETNVEREDNIFMSV